MAVTDKSEGHQGHLGVHRRARLQGLRVGKNELKMGMHGCTTAPLAFSDCEVPAENLLGAEGVGYVQALKTLTMGRVTIAARCCGMMDKLIERCVDYMKMREQGGKKLAEHQGLQWMLADMAVARDAARLLTHRAIETLAARRARHDGSVGRQAVRDRIARKSRRLRGADPRRHGLHARSGASRPSSATRASRAFTKAARRSSATSLRGNCSRISDE